MMGIHGTSLRRWLAATILLALALPAAAAINVLATVPEWAALVEEIGGELVKVQSATGPHQDPHRIEARPSLIARARNADLIVATGAELEAGWLPLVLRESGNARIQAGAPGYFEAAGFVRLIEVPTRLDRADGHVHVEGNPHVHLDPRNIARVADALAARLARIDAANAERYAARNAGFQARWQAAVGRWQAQGARLKGMPVAVQHANWSYLLDWLGLRATVALEPKPGIEPSVAFLGEVLGRLKSEPVKAVLYANYQPPRASQWLAERAGIVALQLPFTVGGSNAARDLFGLFDDLLNRLDGALK